MPKIVNEDVIAKIARYAEKGYSKAAAARELGVDRTTIRKYWPREEEPEVEEQEEKAKPKLSIREEFELLTKKKETQLELESIEFKIEGIEGETEDLRARSEVILDQIKLLGEKLDEAESATDVDEVRELAARVRDDVTAVLAEDEPLRKQREGQQEKEARSVRRKREKNARRLWLEGIGLSGIFGQRALAV